MLKELCNASGVSGDEGAVRQIILDALRGHVDAVRVDVLGNVLAVKKGTGRGERVLVAAHMDEVGFMVSGHDSDGSLRFEIVGGIDERLMIGKAVLIGSQRLPGVIGAAPVHLLNSDRRNAVVKATQLRIDVGVESQEAAKKLVKAGDMAQMERYKQHVVEQALTLLKAHDGIRCLFTTPKLLEALSEKVSLPKLGIKGVFCGGTEMTPQFHRFAVEELLGPDVYFAPTYGNTLMGLAVHRPRQAGDNWDIVYYPPAPRAMMEVVDPNDHGKLVGYGETGRVRLTTLTKEFFMPRFPERDEAEREPPCEAYPWDGVRNVRPFSGFASTVVEGVY